METILPIDYQRMIENRYSDTNIHKLVVEEITTSKLLEAKLDNCVTNIIEWCNQEHYDSKKECLDILKEEDIQDILIRMLAKIMPITGSTTIANIVSQTYYLLPFDKYSLSIQLKRTAELIYQLAIVDIIDITPAFNSEEGTITINNNFLLSEKVSNIIRKSMFLPPMVCEPNKVKSYKDSGYLRKNKYSILKKKHQHNFPINLDAINQFNGTPLSLDIDTLKQTVDEFKDSSKDRNTDDIEMFERYTSETHKVALELIHAGNKFYETYFYDGRGRIYSRGYHINHQGNCYRKAMINFKETGSIEPIDENTLAYFK